uniref:hypothetical protein n=1 Tax=Anaerococcus mediterraneensis TaxID=1870984 RepID=UPI0009300574|nr:hypothetical protein [Anaerococcus mediterraneensis]
MRRRKNQALRKYNIYKRISSILWILTGLGVLAFGIYYREIFELIFGPLAIILGLFNLITRKKEKTIRTYEKKRLGFLSLGLVIYSLVNPLCNLAIIFDLYKRDWVMRGGLDEKL